jgi:hypothetical protein
MECISVNNGTSNGIAEPGDQALRDMACMVSDSAAAEPTGCFRRRVGLSKPYLVGTPSAPCCAMEL